MLSLLLVSLFFFINTLVLYKINEKSELNIYYSESYEYSIPYRILLDSVQMGSDQPIYPNQQPFSCQTALRYPFDVINKTCLYNDLIIIPLRFRSTMYPPSKPLLDSGILFHIYSDDHCQSTNRYMNQLEVNLNAIREMDRNSNIALATNCDVSLSIAQKLTVLIPIHDGDLIKGKPQWYTRLLYNAYTPFNYTFILDTHVFPCYNTSYSEIFRRFKESNVDISISNRMNVPMVSGAAVLSKWGPRSFDYWMRNVRFMKQSHNYDDQYSAIHVLPNQKGYTFKQLSSNWFFASHGITEDGVFVGSAKCYRSSVVVTGPVQWVHISDNFKWIDGKPDQCVLLNGRKDELIDQPRAYFKCGTCTCNTNGPIMATSKKELKSFVGKSQIPQLLWFHDNKRDSRSLFWVAYHVCLILKYIHQETDQFILIY